MKINKIFLLLMLVLLFGAFGCTPASTKESIEIKAQLQQQMKTNSELTKQLEASRQQIEAAKRESPFGANVIGTDGFQWANVAKWDKIILYKTGESQTKVVLTERPFMNNSYFSGSLILQSDPPNGPQGDIEYYTYEFIKENITYRVNVVGRDTIEYKGTYYTTDKYIYNLGKAILSAPKFIKTNSILNKIYESGAMHSSSSVDYLTLNSFRIHGIANCIQEGIDHKTIMAIERPQRNNEKVEEVLTFYYYGQPLVIEIFKSYIHIKDSKENYWYKCDSTESILSVLTAG